MPKEITKKVIGVMKDKLGGQFFIKFVGLIAKIYSCLVDDTSEDKKAQVSKMCVIKKNLEAIELDNKINYLQKMKLAKIVSFVTKENIKSS